MSEWQPIETAPRDGSWIDAWRPEHPIGFRQSRVTVRWDADEECWVWPDDMYDAMTDSGREEAESLIYRGRCFEDSDSFTHWMPLPAKPEPAEGG